MYIVDFFVLRKLADLSTIPIILSYELSEPSTSAMIVMIKNI